MVARLRDLLGNEPLDEHDRLEAQEALDALTAPDDGADVASQKRAVEKLKRFGSDAW